MNASPSADPMDPAPTPPPILTRRELLARCGAGFGSLALAGLLGREAAAASPPPAYLVTRPRAKRIIYLFQSGGPSQMDLFDYKPRLKAEEGRELPEEVR